MIASDPLPEGLSPPVTGGSWIDGPTVLLPSTATGLPLCGVDVIDSPVAGSCSAEDERWGNAPVLGETFMAATSDEAPTEVLRESGATDVIGETEVGCPSVEWNCFNEKVEWGNGTTQGETLVAPVTDDNAATDACEESGSVTNIDETEKDDSQRAGSCSE